MSIGRRTMITGGLATAIGLPYATHHGLISENPLAGLLGDKVGTRFEVSDFDGTLNGTRQLEGKGIDGIEAIFRFDITPEWIRSRWSRISIVPATGKLQGMRVPVVTGTRPDDLAGSLTYYFNQKHQVRRIDFQGITGDDTPLVALLARRFHLRPVPNVGNGIYISSWNGAPLNALRIVQAAPPEIKSQNSQLQVALELNWPAAHQGMSSFFQRQLALIR